MQLWTQHPVASARMGCLLAIDCISMDVPAASPREAFAEIGRLVHAAYGLNRAEVVKRLLRREERRSTGIGYGLALPHADAVGLGRPVAAFVRTRDPMPFQAPDGRPVSNVLALLVPRPATAGHHDLLARYSRLMCRADFRQGLERSKDASSVWRLFDEHARW